MSKSTIKRGKIQSTVNTQEPKGKTWKKNACVVLEHSSLDTGEKKLTQKKEESSVKHCRGSVMDGHVWLLVELGHWCVLMK